MEYYIDGECLSCNNDDGYEYNDDYDTYCSKYIECESCADCDSSCTECVEFYDITDPD